MDKSEKLYPGHGTKSIPGIRRLLKGRGYCPALLFRYDALHSATALLFGSASTTLGRILFGAASTAFCRSCLRWCRLQCSGGCRRGRSRRFRRFRSDDAGAGQETGDAEPCQVLLEIFLIHWLFTSFPGQHSCCRSSIDYSDGTGERLSAILSGCQFTVKEMQAESRIAEMVSGLQGFVQCRGVIAGG